MNRRTPSVSLAPPTLILLGLVLLAPGIARAQTGYKIQRIVKLGDTVADVLIRAKGDLEIGTLNDNGQIAFVTENGNISTSEMLLQYADGKFLPIVVGGRDAPGGTWGKSNNGIPIQVSMNQLGNIVFATTATIGGKTAYGTFLWDFQAQKVTPVAVKGMPAVNNLTFEQGSSGTPLINNHGEIAFPAGVKNAAGGVHSGLFFLGGDGQLQAIALPDQELPGGVKVQDAYVTSMNDTGRVGFVTVKANNGNGAYLWEKGTITQVAAIGMDTPGGKTAIVGGVLLNTQNESVLLDLYLQGNAQNDGLYLDANGSLTPLVVPGQEMPGGGNLLHIGAVSNQNTAGRRAFIGWLKDGTRSVYLLEPDGKLSLILNTGATTDLGKVTNIGSPSPGISFNNKGQIAVNVAFDGVTTLVLLTPPAQ
jgi:hypothetical protein